MVYVCDNMLLGRSSKLLASSNFNVRFSPTRHINLLFNYDRFSIDLPFSDSRICFIADCCFRTCISVKRSLKIAKVILVNIDEARFSSVVSLRLH